MTIENTKPILDQIDPELVETMVADRPGLFSGTAAKLGALASAPVILAAASQSAFGAGKIPQEIVDVLNFALTLEHIENAFYAAGNKAKGLIPAKYRTVFKTIGAHEAAHVKLLAGALGSAAGKAPKADFTAGGKYADVFSNFDTFLTLSQTFEDLGVAAYKGQAGNLIGNDDVLTIALRIHSVEARHAAEVRKIGGKAPWDGAFDKPMTKEEVLAAATPFLKM
jgi:rubrerythrin